MSFFFSVSFQLESEKFISEEDSKKQALWLTQLANLPPIRTNRKPPTTDENCPLLCFLFLFQLESKKRG